MFSGGGLPNKLRDSKEVINCNNAAVFGYYVNDPGRYGVVDLMRKLSH